MKAADHFVGVESLGEKNDGNLLQLILPDPRLQSIAEDLRCHITDILEQRQ
jgi:hypothetical protein